MIANPPLETSPCRARTSKFWSAAIPAASPSPQVSLSRLENDCPTYSKPSRAQNSLGRSSFFLMGDSSCDLILSSSSLLRWIAIFRLDQRFCANDYWLRCQLGDFYMTIGQYVEL